MTNPEYQKPFTDQGRENFDMIFSAKREWKKIRTTKCLCSKCKKYPAVFTKSKERNRAHIGDKARCPACGQHGIVCGSGFGIWIKWESEE